jgi:hypothetical protein
MPERRRTPRRGAPQPEAPPLRGKRGLGEDPLSVDGLLERTFYRNGPDSAPERARTPSGSSAKAKPTHYKVVSISLYTEDIERLEAMVQELKRRGYTKASKSQLIRFALDTVDLDALPRSY